MCDFATDVSPCGDSKSNASDVVSLSTCTKSVHHHLLQHGLSSSKDWGKSSNITEYELILNRAGMFDVSPSACQEMKLDDSRTSMPALARPCTSGAETSKHMQVTCWHCGCRDHYECVDNQYLSPYRTGGKWLPWFLRKSRPFIFKYRPLGPTYFNI